MITVVSSIWCLYNCSRVHHSRVSEIGKSEKIPYRVSGQQYYVASETKNSQVSESHD